MHHCDSNKKIIYTALTNYRDKLKDPLVIDKGFRYICFTDQIIISSIWEITSLRFSDKDPRYTAKWHKLHSHILFPDASVTIWIDASIIIKSSIDSLLDELNEELLLHKHPLRNCIYLEAKACAALKLELSDTLILQTEKYRSLGYGYNKGLYESGVLIRKNTENIKKLNEDWWQEIKKYSSRDQLSLPFIINKLQIPFKILPGFLTSPPFSNFFEIKHHYYLPSPRFKIIYFIHSTKLKIINAYLRIRELLYTNEQ